MLEEKSLTDERIDPTDLEETIAKARFASTRLKAASETGSRYYEIVKLTLWFVGGIGTSFLTFVVVTNTLSVATFSKYLSAIPGILMVFYAINEHFRIQKYKVEAFEMRMELDRLLKEVEEADAKENQ